MLLSITSWCQHNRTRGSSATGGPYWYRLNFNNGKTVILFTAYSIETTICYWIQSTLSNVHCPGLLNTSVAIQKAYYGVDENCAYGTDGNAGLCNYAEAINKCKVMTNASAYRMNCTTTYECRVISERFTYNSSCAGCRFSNCLYIEYNCMEPDGSLLPMSQPSATQTTGQ